METGNGDAPRAFRAADFHNRIQYEERDTHIGSMCGETLLARSEDGVHAVKPSGGRATRSGRSLVAGFMNIAKICAARPLHQISADRCHIP